MHGLSFLRAGVLAVLLFGIVPGAPAVRAAPDQLIIDQTTFKSQGSKDGYVVELDETANVGGLKGSAAQYIYVGDGESDSQVRGILSFRTEELPDTATVTKVVLKLYSDWTIGNDPFDSMGHIVIEMRSGSFGDSANLEAKDWQAAAQVNAGKVFDTPVDDWYKVTLLDQAEPYINLTGITQIRLRFKVQDNDNATEDMIAFHSGDFVTTSTRPRLQVTYFTP